jgi:ABC-type cobalamin/Fe3+-siderophores transport system ATPase subunit
VIDRETNLTVLVVKKNANVALMHADYGYIMESGRVVLEGTAGELKDNPDVKEFYLGVTEAGAKATVRSRVTSGANVGCEAAHRTRDVKRHLARGM